EAGIVDDAEVSQAYGRWIQQAGAVIQRQAKFLMCERQSDGLVLETTGGPVDSRFLINCGGLQSDRVARLCGVEPGLQVVPFRGEYYELVAERRSLVRNLIYPVPDPRFPFLGVHFTRTVHGGVEAGPTGILRLKRRGS